MTQDRNLRDIGADKSLLIVDDDEPFLRRLQRAMEKRGFEVEAAGSVAGGKAICTARPPAYAVVDLRLEDGNGLDVVETLREKRPDSRIVVLTGYGAIATAVAAVKIGATDYLSKPADANDITAALLAEEEEMPAPAREPDVGGSRAVGAYPARLRALRPQRVGNRAPSEHASPHASAHPCQAQPALTPPIFASRAPCAIARGALGPLPDPSERLAHAPPRRPDCPVCRSAVGLRRHPRTRDPAPHAGWPGDRTHRLRPAHRFRPRTGGRDRNRVAPAG
ncbi:Dna binding protein response regulator PrrA (RegA) [Roseibacterium elongatum DSM 19469]|uniref:Dna binding protein response regulator PrrA (RegA) n=1 Tax=Roseicyclus elongatus DSM 19469 TaxID=1294273 RepID=W8SMK8_9RHOB|nr:Dna binding protein response regulator PrrA (RegA) [Roseibacterium elongatum DSM 19469]